MRELIKEIEFYSIKKQCAVVEISKFVVAEGHEGILVMMDHRVKLVHKVSLEIQVHKEPKEPKEPKG